MMLSARMVCMSPGFAALMSGGRFFISEKMLVSGKMRASWEFGGIG